MSRRHDIFAPIARRVFVYFLPRHWINAPHAAQTVSVPRVAGENVKVGAKTAYGVHFSSETQHASDQGDNGEFGVVAPGAKKFGVSQRAARFDAAFPRCFGFVRVSGSRGDFSAAVKRA